MPKRKRSIDTETEKKIMQYFSLRDDYKQLETRITKVGNIEDKYRVQGYLIQADEYNQQWHKLVDQATHVYNEIQSLTPIFHQIDMFSASYAEIETKAAYRAFFRKSFSRTGTESTLEMLSTATTLETNSQKSVSLNTPAALFHSVTSQSLLDEPAANLSQLSY